MSSQWRATFADPSRNRNIFLVFDAARRYSRALEKQSREDGKRGLAIFVLVALAAACFAVALARI